MLTQKQAGQLAWLEAASQGSSTSHYAINRSPQPRPLWAPGLWSSCLRKGDRHKAPRALRRVSGQRAVGAPGLVSSCLGFSQTATFRFPPKGGHQRVARGVASGAFVEAGA